MEKIALGMELASLYSYKDRVEKILKAVENGILTTDEAIECIKAYAAL